MPYDESFRFLGHPVFAGGTTRGSSTASGIFSVSVAWSGIQRKILWADMSDEASNLRVTASGGGPAQTQSTFYQFVPQTHVGLTARFRVLRHKASSDMNASFTLASSVTGIRARYIALGW